MSGGGHDAPKKAPPPKAGTGLSHPLIAWLVFGPLLLFGASVFIWANRDPVLVALSVRLQTPGETRSVTLPSPGAWIKLEAEEGLRYEIGSPGKWWIRFRGQDDEWDHGEIDFDSPDHPIVYVKGGSKGQKFTFKALSFKRR
jgi:hypothetical protein